MSETFTGCWNKVLDSEPPCGDEYLVKFTHKGSTIYGSTVAYWSSEGWVKMQTADEPATPDDYLLERGNIIVTHWAHLPIR